MGAGGDPADGDGRHNAEPRAGVDTELDIETLFSLLDLAASAGAVWGQWPEGAGDAIITR